MAEDFHRRSHYDAIGITGGDGLGVDSTRVMSHVRSLRDRFVRGVMGDMESWVGEHLRADDYGFEPAGSVVLFRPARRYTGLNNGQR